MTLAILDLDYGNTDSIRLAFARLGVEAVLVRDAQTVEAAERLVFPGVGAAGYAMQRIRDLGLVEPLKRRSRPTLGICLGMQLLFDHSEEADTPGLGLLSGGVRAFAPAPGYPVPHMGWSRLRDVAGGIGLNEDDHVYFAHGFACDDTHATAARADYGDLVVTAAIRQGHLWGAQFHPERSSAPGAKFLTAFLSA